MKTEKKKYVLTDLKRDCWKGMDKESLEKVIERLNSNPAGMYGELSHGSHAIDRLTISVDDVSHRISNIQLSEGAVEGDVEFLDTENGKRALEMIDNGIARFGMRATGYRRTEDGENKVIVKRIYSWDVIPKT